MWVIEHGQWVAKYMTTSNSGKDNYIKELIKSGQIETVKPKWKNIKIGNLELKSAKNFRDHIDKTAINHVVYLSGIVNNDELSKHLESRKNVELELAKGKYFS